MKFLLKKESNEKNELTLEELVKKLGLISLNKNVEKLRKEVDEILNQPLIDKKYILSLIKGDFLSSGELLNASNAASVEKMKGLPEGIFYYNKTKKCLRLKLAEGWVSLKTE